MAPSRSRASPPPTSTPDAPASPIPLLPAILPGSRTTSSSALSAERALRQRIRTSLADWARLALAPRGHEPAAHHLRLIAELEALARGTSDRLLVLMPPGAAKSTYASTLFPAWWFAQDPASRVIATSHTASLAGSFAREVRRLLDEHGARLGCRPAADTRGAADWDTRGGGGYFATGIRGPVTGRRADLIILDDPLKSHAEADSSRNRDEIWAWFRSDLLTRLRPHGRVLVVMTRWHEDDLAGRLLEDDAGDWRCLRLPAFAEANDPLGRAQGAALWPQWESRDMLERKRRSIGERAFSALYQQSPTPPAGLVFETARIGLSEAAPVEAERVRAWDLAASAAADGTDPDWTVGVRLAREPSGRFVVEDVVRLQGGPHEVEAAIRATAERDGTAVRISLPQDPGQAGRSQVLYLIRALAGFTVAASPESGAKTTRAMPAAAQANAGNLVLLRGAWNRGFLTELADFPVGRKDDQVDALARAFAALLAAPARTRAVRVGLLGR